MKTESSSPVEQSVDSVDSFGWQWTQRQVIGTTRDFYRMLFSSRGIWWDHYDGKIVADVGSGMGRTVYAFCKLARAKQIISVELSPEAMEKQKRYLTDNSIEFIQGDMATVKFKADMIYAAGVIQHTRDPGSAIKNLHDNLSDNGELLISFYLRTPTTMALEPLRFLLKRLPKGVLWALTPLLAPIFMARPDGRRFGFKNARHTAYDWFGGHRYQHYFTQDSILDTLKAAGFHEMNVLRVSKGLYRVRKGPFPVELDDERMVF